MAIVRQPSFSVQLRRLLSDRWLWISLASVIPMVVIAEVIRLVGWASYLVAPGGAIADAMLLLSAFALVFFGRKAIRQTFEARTARRAGLSVTRFRPSVLTATFLLLTTTTLLVNVVVKSVIGPELTHREVASILNKEIADDVPFLSVRF